MSKGIVLELQQELINPEIRIYDILLKAFFIAEKLELRDIKDWINSELEGYKGKEVPNYRILKGNSEYWDYWRGWRTFQFHVWDEELYEIITEKISTTPILNSISEIEEWLRSDKEFMYLTYPPDILFKIRETFKDCNETEFRLSIHRSQIKNIINQVRKKLLEWTLELERKGVVGENLSFTRDEKTKAEKLQQTFITNVYGSSNINISQISSEQGNINQNNKLEINNILYGLEQELNKIKDKLPDEKKKLLEKELKILREVKNKPESKLEKIRSTLSNIKDILQSSEYIISMSGKVIEIIDKFPV